MNGPRLLLYTEEFLSPSMTFIARQIKSMQGQFEVIVLTRVRRNFALFPFDRLELVPFTFVERLRGKVLRALGGRDWTLYRSTEERLGRVIDQLQPDLIHAHFGPSGLAVLPLARARGIPLIVTFHGFDASTLLARSDYKSDLIQLFAYAEIVTVSQEMRKRLISNGANPSRTHCHYIGVPTRQYIVASREPIVDRLKRNETIRFLQVANFVEKKGHEITLRAFSMLREHVKNCQLVLAGAGPLLEPMKALAANLGQRESVKFLGHQDSQVVASLMRETDCFVHHSVTAANGDTEGIPTVLMEAMASGLPVISTRHAGIPELITDGIDGFLVTERDVDAYAAAMLAMLTDNGDMGKRAQTKVEGHFNIESCSLELTERFKTLYPSAPFRQVHTP